MTTDSSATTREETPHSTQIPYGDQPSRTNTIVNALVQRAQEVLNDHSIDAQSRAIIRYALETNDPWLARLVNRVDAHKTIRVDVGESLTEALGVLQTSETDDDASSEQASAAVVQQKMAALAREKVETLAEIICGAGNQSAASLLVLMDIVESSTDPKALAHAAKHFAFTRCGELNVCGMVEAQIAIVERELCAGIPLQL